jgi:proteasome activator subunit 4
MSFPDISALNIVASHTGAHLNDPPCEHDVQEEEDRYMVKLQNYAKSLPYSIGSCSKMMELLDFILLRITQCVEAKDYEIGFVQWDSMLN